MQDNTNKFNKKAKDYVKYRPTYPDEFIDYLIKDLKIKNKIVADIGSGTGKLTELIVNNVKKVYAIEPNKDMRIAAEKILNKNKNFISINGCAEDSKLKNNFIDVIIVAQAFHWFDIKKTMVEFKRILKKNGLLVLVWNTKIHNTNFLKTQLKILSKYSNKVKTRNKNSVKKAFPNGYLKKSYWHNQEFDLKGVLGRISSLSYCPAQNTKQYKIIEKQITNAFNKYSKNGFIKYNYKTNAYIGKI